MCKYFPPYQIQKLLVRNGDALLYLDRMSWSVGKIIECKTTQLFTVLEKNSTNERHVLSWAIRAPVNKLKVTKSNRIAPLNCFRNQIVGLSITSDLIAITSPQPSESSTWSMATCPKTYAMPLSFIYPSASKYMFGNDVNSFLIPPSTSFQTVIDDVLDLCGQPYSEELQARIGYISPPNKYDAYQECIVRVLYDGKIKRLTSKGMLGFAIKTICNSGVSKQYGGVKQVMVCLPDTVMSSSHQLNGVISAISKCRLHLLGLIDERIAALLTYRIISVKSTLSWIKFKSSLLDVIESSKDENAVQKDIENEFCNVLIINCSKSCVQFSLYDCSDMSSCPKSVIESTVNDAGHSAFMDSILNYFCRKALEQSNFKELASYLKKPKYIQKIKAQCELLSKEIFSKGYSSISLQIPQKRYHFIEKITRYDLFNCFKEVYEKWEIHLSRILKLIPNSHQNNTQLATIVMGKDSRFIPGILRVVDNCLHRALNVSEKEDIFVDLYEMKFTSKIAQIQWSMTLHNNMDPSEGLFLLRDAMIDTKIAYETGLIYNILSEETKLLCALITLLTNNTDNLPLHGNVDMEALINWMEELLFNKKCQIKITNKFLCELNTLLRDGIDINNYFKYFIGIGKTYISHIETITATTDMELNISYITEKLQQIKNCREMSICDISAPENSQIISFNSNQVVEVFVENISTDKKFQSRQLQGKWIPAIYKCKHSVPKVVIIPDAWNQNVDATKPSTIEVEFDDIGIYPNNIPPHKAFTLDTIESVEGRKEMLLKINHKQKVDELLPSMKEDLFSKSKYCDSLRRYVDDISRYCNNLLDRRRSDVLPLHFSSGLPELLSDMLQPNPRARLSIEDVCQRIKMLKLPSECSFALQRIADIEEKLTGVETDVAMVKRQVQSQQRLLEGLLMEANDFPRLVLVIPEVDGIESFQALFDGAGKDITKASAGMMDRLLSGKGNFSLGAFKSSIKFSSLKLLQKMFRVYTVCEFTYRIIPTEITLCQPREWLIKAAPFIKASLLAARLIGTLTGFPVGGIVDAVSGGLDPVLDGGDKVNDTISNVMNQASLVSDSLVLFQTHLDTKDNILKLVESLIDTNLSRDADIFNAIRIVLTLFPSDYDQLNNYNLQALSEALCEISESLLNIEISCYDLYAHIGVIFMANKIDGEMTSKVLEKSINPNAEGDSETLGHQLFTLAISAASCKQYDDAKRHLLAAANHLSTFPCHDLQSDDFTNTVLSTDNLLISPKETHHIIRILNAFSCISTDSNNSLDGIKYRLRSIILERYGDYNTLQYLTNIITHINAIAVCCNETKDNNNIQILLNTVEMLHKTLRKAFVAKNKDGVMDSDVSITLTNVSIVLSIISNICLEINIAESIECCYAMLLHARHIIESAIDDSRLMVDRVTLFKAASDIIYCITKLLYDFVSTEISLRFLQPSLTGMYIVQYDYYMCYLLYNRMSYSIIILSSFVVFITKMEHLFYSHSKDI
jgi:hypothetical protein